MYYCCGASLPNLPAISATTGKWEGGAHRHATQREANICFAQYYEFAAALAVAEAYWVKHWLASRWVACRWAPPSLLPVVAERAGRLGRLAPPSLLLNERKSRTDEKHYSRSAFVVAPNSNLILVFWRKRMWRKYRMLPFAGRTNRVPSLRFSDIFEPSGFALGSNKVL